jgi:Leucine-rich repeat (LRR) protein
MDDSDANKVSEAISTFLSNRERYSAISSQLVRPLVVSLSLSRIRYDSKTRAQTQHMIISQFLTNPRHRPDADMPAEQLRISFVESKPLFQLSLTPAENPPLQTLKPSKSCGTTYFDLGFCYFSSEEPFHHLSSRFAGLRIISLRDCGLVTLPKELETLPKKCRFLDLSMNYLSELPDKIHWDKLTGLNLNENAFLEWPAILNPTSLPRLRYLYFAANPYSKAFDITTGFPRLRTLDLSYTKLTHLPAWVRESNTIRWLSLAGVSAIKSLSPQILVQNPALKFVDFSSCGLEDGGPIEAVKGLAIFIMKGLPPELAPQPGPFTMII